MPYINWDARELAAYLAKNHRDAKECWDLVIWDIGPHPQTGMLRAQCIHEYASINKDPSVCELIMPSDYGFSCVNAAKNEVGPCDFGADPQRTVSGQGIVTTYDECISEPSATKSHVCCEMARLTFEKDEPTDCSIFDQSDALTDQCHHQVALKEKDIASCEKIQSLNLRIACQVEVRALNAAQ